MFDCKRSTTDPLLKLMLHKHRLHVLQWPRGDVLPGELIIEKQGGQTLRAPLSDVFSSGMSDSVRKRAVLSDIEERFSDKFKAKLGVKLLDHIAKLFGGNSASFNSAYAEARTVSVRISLAQWLDCDPAKLSDFIAEAVMRERQGSFSEGDRLYVITGVAVAKAIEVIAQDNSGAAMAAVAEAAAATAIDAGLSARRVGNGGVVYSGQRPLAFGVELFELESGFGRWKIKGVGRYVQVRGDSHYADRLPLSEAAFIGDARDGPAFIEVKDLEAP